MADSASDIDPGGLLFIQAPDPLWAMDADGRLRAANLAFRGLLGLDAQAPLPQAPWHWTADLDEAGWRSLLRQAGPTPVAVVARWRAQDGSTCLVETRLRRPDGPGPAWCLASSRDVTAQRAAAEVTETALREGEERLALALSASRLGVWDWELGRDTCTLSPEAHAVLGLPGPRPAAGGTRLPMAALTQRLPQASLQRLQDVVRCLRQNPGGFDLTLQSVDGRWLECRGRLAGDAPDGPQRVVGTVLDVTDQHALQQRLRDDALRRRVMIEQSRDGVLVLTTDGAVDEVNQAFADMLGHPVEAVRAMRVWDWDVGFGRDRLLRMLQQPNARGSMLQTRMRRQDGRTISAEVSSTGLVLGGRQLFFCVCRDVTERLAIETALRESEARLRATFDNSAVGMAEHAVNGQWLNVNPRLCEITGRSREALMAIDFRLLTHPDDRIDEWPRLRHVMRGDQVHSRREKRYLRPDGSVVWVAVTTSAVRDARGRAAYFVSVIEDITWRKRIETELARHRQHLETEVADRTRALEQAMRARIDSERFLRSVADNIPDMVGYWDAQRVLRFANRPYREWISPERDPVGSQRHDLLPAAELQETEDAFVAAMGGRPQRFERVLTSAASEVRFVWVHYIPDRQDGRVVGLFVLLSDISEAKQAELRLQALNEQLVAARDRAEAANRAKSAFLANISHEIRTPMNAIIGLTHLMQRDAGNGPGAERLGKISDAAHHLLDVINDVLDLSKIESGKLRLEQTDFPVDAVLSRACALVADRARAKGLEMVLQSDGVPQLLRGDPTRVSQALLNLMSNAVKFTDHGAIVLRCELMTADATGLRLRFSVRDTGVGVPADKIDDLFNAFEQADTSTTRRFGGTGLGLAITRRLALLMGGDVGVHSVQGQGSCFWFTAHFDRASQQVLSDNAALAGRRALVADDLPDARAALADLLRRLGMLVDSVAGGDDAVEAALQAAQRGWPYDLLLLDADMPGTDGRAALRQLRARLGAGPTAAGMPPCLLIVDDDPAIAAQPLDDGVEPLGKPVTQSALAAAIERLERQPWSVGRVRSEPAGAQPHERALQQRARGQRVLLAEDNLVNQEVARELLLAVGMRVDLAADGQEAVGLAAQRDYDLVLMDMQMPVMDGLQATRALRQMPRHARTPILAMTANAFGDDRRACLAAGMDDHIAKPVDPELLYAMLNRWLPARVVDAATKDEAAPAACAAAQGAAGAPPELAPAVVAAAPGQAPATGQAHRAATAPAQSGSGPAHPPGGTVDAGPAPTPAPDFSNIPGLAMSRALLYLPGRDTIFARVLRQFCDQHGDGLPALQAALRGGDLAGARRQLHALRGACGAVGATAVQAEALALEQHLLASEQAGASGSSPSLDGVDQPLQQALRALVGAVRARLAQGDGPAAAGSTPLPAAAPPVLSDAERTRLRADLGQLAEQLRQADFRAGAGYLALEPALRAALGGAALQRLGETLAQHDYEAAQRAAEGLLRALDAPAQPA